MNVFQQNLDRLSFSKRIPLLFFIMTFSAILPLYFENTRQLSGLIFVSILLFLSFFSFKTPLFKLTKTEKIWLYVAISYAVVFILNYVLRTPHTADGEWRNAAPVFILLISVWYFLSIRFNQKKCILKYVAWSSLLCALGLFITEISMIESLTNYRLGVVFDGARGLAATGFILPMTTGLFIVLWLKERTLLYFILLVIAFCLSGMNGSKTSFSILALMILFGMLYLFIWSSGLSKRVKWLMIGLMIGLFASSAYLSKSKLVSVVNDVESIKTGDYMTSTGLRYAMFNLGAEALKGQWLFGVGPSQYKTYITAVAEESNYSAEVKEFVSGVMQIHNQYIMSLLLTGVLGAITLMLLLTYPVKVFLTYFRHHQDPAALISVGLLLGVIFIMFFGAVLTYTYTTIFYMLAVSALISWFGDEKGELD